jgi:hypothetical protein
MDVDQRGGTRFREATLGTLGGVPVVVVVVGRGWMSWWNRWRLRRPDDWVRSELLASLQRTDLLLLPVLVDGVQMPDARTLPEPLRPFCDCVARRVRAEDWVRDVEPVVQDIKDYLERSRRVLPRSRIPRRVAYLCDRLNQIEQLEKLCVAARKDRSLVCVVPGHEEDAHEGFLGRVMDDRVLQKGFGVPPKVKVERRRLHDPHRRRSDPLQALCSALKYSRSESFTLDDSELEGLLQDTVRPVVFTMQVLASDLGKYGPRIMEDFAAAWNVLIKRLESVPAGTGKRIDAR